MQKPEFCIHIYTHCLYVYTYLLLMCAGWVAFISTQFTHIFGQQVIPRTTQKLFNTLKHTFKNNFIVISLPKYKHNILKVYPFLQREKKVLIIGNEVEVGD